MPGEFPGGEIITTQVPFVPELQFETYEGYHIWRQRVDERARLVATSGVEEPWGDGPRARLCQELWIARHQNPNYAAVYDTDRSQEIG